MLGQRIRAQFAQVAVVLAAGFIYGCGTAAFPPAPVSAAPENYKYVIGPGDILNIVVWRNPELSLTVTVRPDGRVAAPLVEDVPAEGKDPTALGRDIEKALSKVIRDAVVTVIVNSSGGGASSERIRVIGEAAKPQVLAYRQKMTLLDVMIAVGGITDFADGNRATILRASEGNKQYSVRLKDLVRRGDISANVEMVPGDVLVIPQSWF